MNITICDDDPLQQQSLQGMIERWAAQEECAVSLRITAFTSTEELLGMLQNGLMIDLLFLDIQIPGEMNGLQLAQEIRKTNENMQIVFVTHYAEYACAGYRVHAMRYLIKPIFPEQLTECLKIAYHQWKYAQVSSVFLTEKKQSIILPHKSILYLEAQGHHLLIHRADAEPLSIRVSIQQALLQLPPETFVQCHRSYIVNLHFVRCLRSDTAVLADESRIPIGNKYIESIFTAARHYYQGASV